MASKLHEQYDLAIFQLALYILITPFTLYAFVNACTTRRACAVKTRKSSGTFLFSNLGLIALHVVVSAPAVLVGVGASKFFTSSNFSDA
ncbi:hypothetical protein M409DRAFT_23293 [Zasmidium cellare ATCC 36951]|uniref:Uncharacterized protein n=1 Tax=Zasmidium cellare ATCC 36951 TaxID=1080233 RepID=A0A6A6CL54_ZASCE|nr:uncharacterized protein M409DRAFT_23293 [Zasmidium cellare ATCC 36951]KAF2166662.1 hypothetical protein M409DRAFT_23293 [Zasmidium cellare ATCC 36951]